MAGLGDRVLAQRRAVFGVEHAVFGERRGHCARERPAVCEHCAGVPLYEHQPIAGVTPRGRCSGSIRTRSSRRWTRVRELARRYNAQTCQFGNLGRNALRGPDFAWGDFYLTKWFTLREHVKLRLEGSIQPFQSSKLRATDSRRCRNSRKTFDPNRIRSAYLCHRAADRIAWCRTWRRQFSAMIAFQARLEF